MATTEHLVFGILAILIGGFIFFRGFNVMHKYRLIMDIPRSKIRSIAMGLVEIHGKVKENAKKLILSFVSNKKCVYSKLLIKEYRKHTTSSGKGGSRTYYSWDTIYTDVKLVPFYAKDDTGEVTINPAGAEFNLKLKGVYLRKGGIIGLAKAIKTAFKKDEEKDKNKDMLNISKLSLTPLEIGKEFYLGTSVGDRKYYEYYLEPEEELYVLGTACNDSKEKNKIVIRQGENEKTFLISNLGEDGLLKSLKRKTIGIFLSSSFLIVLGVILIVIYIGG